MISFLCEKTHAAVGNGQQWSRYSEDKLIGAMIGLARATDGNEHLITESSTAAIIEGLDAARFDKNCDAELLERLRERVVDEKRKMVPDCFVCAAPCGRTDDYDMKNLWDSQEDVRSLKLLILLGIQWMTNRARYDAEVERFLYKGLVAIGIDDFGEADLMPIVREVGRRCAALTDGTVTAPNGLEVDWYEPNAVCIFLSLLHLGMKDIRIDPALPTFLSPNVLRLLLEE